MKKLTFLTMVLGILSVLTASAQRKQCIDSNWHFFYGDGSAAVTNPSVADTWRTLALPHDWSVETEAAQKAGGRVIGPFSTNSIGGFQTGFTVGGEGWYQRTLTVTADDLAGRVVLYFEGAYNQSYLYVNGTLCHTNVYGYSSFRQDVTTLLHEGENNVVVKVENTGNNTRWYAGSGIYRHVWLVRYPSVHLDEWDTYIKTSENRTVMVSALVHNESKQAAAGSIDVQVLDSEGQSVGSADAAFENIAAGTSGNTGVELTVENAETWSPASPYLYTAVVSIKDEDGHVVDSFRKRFGFRTLSFSASEGFLLNGVNTLIKGGCAHHDNGLLGAAAFDKAERRKLQLIKNLGYNAVRCSHNIPSENYLDVCDELGLMVIDECFDQWMLKKNPDDYHKYFREHGDEDLAVMLRRDRNHPSVIMWSIGNEIPGRITDEGMAVAAHLRNGVLAEDDTRPVSAAVCGWEEYYTGWADQSEKAFVSLDVGGYNYMYSEYENDHRKYPNRVICGFESYPKLASENWTLVEKHPYVIGDFVWTVVDYLGEAGIGAAYPDHAPSLFQDWPWFNGHCGDIDLIGQKKPQSYYKDIVWREAPVTMAVETTGSQWNGWGWQLEEQSWTYPGLEGQNVNINVYSRAPKVRLYLNDVAQGDHVPGTTFWTGYNIAYQPGTLRVVNLDASGNEIPGEEFVLKTTGQATGVRLVYYDDINTIEADEQNLCYVTIELIDDEGNVVTSDKETRINVTNMGAGELIGCCTANPTDMKSFRSFTPTVYRGRALAVVRGNGTAGTVDLKVEILEPEVEPTTFFLKDPDFEADDLEAWVISDSKIIRQKLERWHETNLNNYIECASWLGPVTTLANQSVSQCTKVLPAGTYTVQFDYNGTCRNGTSGYQTTGTLKGVTVSMGGTQIELTTIDAELAQQGTLTFTLDQPQAVCFLLSFSASTNCDWLALDNITYQYSGDYDFEQNYQDFTSRIPEFGNGKWAKVSGNAAGGYTETKLASPVWNNAGLAYWSAMAPKNTDLFRQDITGLPAGRYGIASCCAANLWSSSDNDRNHRDGTSLFARTSGGTEASTPITTAIYDLFSLVIDINEGETLTLGMHAEASNGNNWCYLAQPTLVRLTSPTPTAMEEVKNEQSKVKMGTIYDLGGRRFADESVLADSNIYIANGRKMMHRHK